MEIWKKIASICAFVLPLWNIPLIWRILSRKSSQDVSLPWAVGVWICFALMAPAGLVSEDAAFRIFTLMNMLFFTLVVAAVVRYHRPKE